MIQKFIRYNSWANQKITGFILSAGESIAEKELQSSFPTILKTLLHIWDAQLIWYARLNGESLNSFPSKNFNGSLSEACTGLLSSSNDFVARAETFSNDANAQIQYKALDGKSYINSTEEVIMHCMNHGTYHRGQIITMLRQAGFTDVGSTDFIRFCRENNL